MKNQEQLLSQILSEDNKLVGNALQELCDAIYDSKIFSFEKRLRNIALYKEMQPNTWISIAKARQIVMNFIFMDCREKFVRYLRKKTPPRNLVACFTSYVEQEIGNAVKKSILQKRIVTNIFQEIEEEDDINTTSIPYNLEAFHDFEKERLIFFNNVALQAKLSIQEKNMLFLYMEKDNEEGGTFNSNIFDKAKAKIKKNIPQLLNSFKNWFYILLLTCIILYEIR